MRYTMHRVTLSAPSEARRGNGMVFQRIFGKGGKPNLSKYRGAATLILKNVRSYAKILFPIKSRFSRGCWPSEAILQ